MISEKIEVDRSDVLSLIQNQIDVNEKCLILIKLLRSHDIDTLNKLIEQDPWVNDFILSLISLKESADRLHNALMVDFYKELKKGLMEKNNYDENK